MALGTLGILGAVASVGGAAIQASAANRAANAQKQAAQDQIAFQTETRDQIRADLAPYLTGGTNALSGYLYEMGLGEKPADYQGYTKTPGYDFRLQQGTDALQAGAAAQGGLYSGRAMKALQNYGQDYASGEYNNYLSRMGGLIDTGMNAASMSGNASQNAAAGVSNALGSYGNAAAAGAIGAANAWNNGIQNALGAWNYQQQLGQSANQTGNRNSWLNWGSA